jgi:hypothetical protein
MFQGLDPPLHDRSYSVTWINLSVPWTSARNVLQRSDKIR